MKTSYSPEYRRYYPQWMTTNYSSGSLLSNFYTSAWLHEYAQVQKDLQDYSGGSTFSSWGQPRLAWLLYTKENASKNNELVFYCPEGSGTITQVIDTFDFLSSTTPVFKYLRDGVIILRNLEVIETTRIPSSGYLTNLGLLVEDIDVWYKVGSEFERIQCYTNNWGISGDVFTPRITSTVFRYSSKALTTSLDASGFVLINNNPAVKLIPVDIENSWDATGDLIGVRRLPREDNYSYYNRLKSKSYIPGLTSSVGIEAGVSRCLDLVNFTTWQASSVLIFPYQDVKEIKIYGNKQVVTINEVPIKLSDNTYALVGIPDSGLIYLNINNIVTKPSSGSNNTIYVNNELEENPVANYSITRYLVNRGASGYINSVQAVSGNLDTTQSHLIYYTRGIKVATTNSPINIDRILTPEGTSKDYLFRLIKYELNTLGHSQWGNINWFEDTQVKPEMSYAPLSLDF